MCEIHMRYKYDIHEYFLEVSCIIHLLTCLVLSNVAVDDATSPLWSGLVYSTGELENSTKTLKPGFVKYAVDANLFRLGSTNPIKKIQPLVFLGFFLGFYTGGSLSRRFFRGLLVGRLLTGNHKKRMYFITNVLHNNMHDMHVLMHNDKNKSSYSYYHFTNVQ